MFFDTPGRGSRKILVCAGVFLLPVGERGVSVKILFCSYIFLRAGATWHFCSVPLMPCRGAPVHFLAGLFQYSLTWILEKLWYVPVFFCWLLVKRLISQKTLLCVVISVNENSVALFFQDSLVLCSVKCKGWPFGTL